MYSTYLGGHDNDEGHGVAVDTNGNAYVAGNTSSGDFPLRRSLSASGRMPAAFVTRISPAPWNGPVAVAQVSGQCGSPTGRSLFTLDGSASHDPNGAPLTYSWKHDDELLGTTATVSTVGYPYGGLYVLTVSNTKGETATAGDQIFIHPSECPDHDIQAPTAPLLPRFTNPAAGSLNLSWGASIDNEAVTGYLIDVATDPSFANLLPAYSSMNVGNTTGVVIAGLGSGGTYYARVIATDAEGNRSAYSSTAIGTTVATDTTPPSTTASASPSAGLSGWNRSTVIVS